MKWCLPFGWGLNFLDPLLTNDGRPYGPYRYKQIQKECYLISKNSSTSYDDVLRMTPIEREYWLEFIQDEFKKTQEMIDKSKNKQ